MTRRGRNGTPGCANSPNAPKPERWYQQQDGPPPILSAEPGPFLAHPRRFKITPEINVRKRKLRRLDVATVSRQPADAGLNVKIIPNVQGTPPSKLADAELEFTDGPLEGLRLIGFAVWESRDGERIVIFPAGAPRFI